MILIADSGSTKTSWCLLNPPGKDFHFSTQGYNPYYMDAGTIIASIMQSLPLEVFTERIRVVHFYGAGCSQEKAFIVEKALTSVFPNATISVKIDLLAAAKSVLGNKAGFVGILGTGTNSCMYDGKDIEHVVDSLGFMLGDEGSGAYIGKQLLVGYARGFLPDDLKEKFYETYRLAPENVVDRVYNCELPNTYCANFCIFVGDNISHPFISNLVRSAFADFFEGIVSNYANYRDYEFNCVGSIAHSFLPQLKEVAAQYGMKIGNIVRNPLDGLINYHRKTISFERV
ncbi:N-acetylglucosamine kinase [Pelobium manganitolerans]|uniref:N-acetylglucosamine kinase n=1 Tax=Pelobium manganitolerans TaxID=1842495 RepID=A0A419S257_9SPHI|nr:N-acetylglucosamine kinase [Pelobium manganitolerans]RKD12803.1 N-acetylglucosamine kinase [Pelobium manganitolerans]